MWAVEEVDVESFIPRLSAAITTPSANFRASTEVPVTIGDWVCWIPSLFFRYEAS